MKPTVVTIPIALLLTMGTVNAHAMCEANEPLTIVSAIDDGLYEETHGPSNTIDGNYDPDSRWSNQSQGDAKHIQFDLGAEQTLKSFSIAWHKGDSRWSAFSLETSTDGESFTQLVPPGKSSGTTLELETYEFEAVQAQYIKLLSNGNASNDWNSVVEVVANGCGVAVEKPAQPILTERHFRLEELP